MKYLLDTHYIIWIAENSEKVSEIVRSIVADENAQKYVSIVSAWETEIKLSSGKLRIDGGIDGFFQIVVENGFALLGVEKEYVRQLSVLPYIHRDPFDRMLIATAIVEDLQLVTADINIAKYNVPQMK
jgi:PIN domain nuclease of toxin-antitoxin system